MPPVEAPKTPTPVFDRVSANLQNIFHLQGNRNHQLLLESLDVMTWVGGVSPEALETVRSIRSSFGNPESPSALTYVNFTPAAGLVRELTREQLEEFVGHLITRSAYDSLSGQSTWKGTAEFDEDRGDLVIEFAAPQFDEEVLLDTSRIGFLTDGVPVRILTDCAYFTLPLLSSEESPRLHLREVPGRQLESGVTVNIDHIGPEKIVELNVIGRQDKPIEIGVVEGVLSGLLSGAAIEIGTVHGEKAIVNVTSTDVRIDKATGGAQVNAVGENAHVRISESGENFDAFAIDGKIEIDRAFKPNQLQVIDGGAIRVNTLIGKDQDEAATQLSATDGVIALANINETRTVNIEGDKDQIGQLELPSSTKGLVVQHSAGRHLSVVAGHGAEFHTAEGVKACNFYAGLPEGVSSRVGRFMEDASGITIKAVGGAQLAKASTAGDIDKIGYVVFNGGKAIAVGNDILGATESANRIVESIAGDPTSPFEI